MRPYIPLKKVIIAAYGDAAVSNPCETVTKRKSVRRKAVELLTVPIFEAADALGPSIPLKEVINAAYNDDAAVSTPRETATKRKSFRKNVMGLLTVPIFEAADALGARK